MVVVKELAAKLHVQLAAELGHPLTDMVGLQLQILFVVESDFHGLSPS